MLWHLHMVWCHVVTSSYGMMPCCDIFAMLWHLHMVWCHVVTSSPCCDIFIWYDAMLWHLHMVSCCTVMVCRSYLHVVIVVTVLLFRYLWCGSTLDSERSGYSSLVASTCTRSSHGSSSYFKRFFVNWDSSSVPNILKNIACFPSNFGSPGSKFSGFRIFCFGLGASSTSHPNFSVLPYLEVG
jgi:hypothetical protein